MKFYITLFFCLLLFTSSFAQVPNKISYQGILTDQNGQLVINNNYDITFKLYDTITGGTALWQELQTVPVANGIFNVVLGAVNTINLPFNKQYYLGIKVGSGIEFEPRIVLTSNPYSIRAKTVDEIMGKPLTTTVPSNGQVIGFNGTQWQPINISSNGIGGTGTSNYIPFFSNTSTLGNSVIQQSNGNIGINTESVFTNALTIGKSTTPTTFVKLNSGSNAGLSLVAGSYFSSIYQNSTVGDLNFAHNGVKMKLLNNGHLTLGNTFIDSAIINVRTNRKYAGYFQTDSSNGAAGLVGVWNNTSGNGIGVLGLATSTELNYSIGGKFIGNYTSVMGFIPRENDHQTMSVYGINQGSGSTVFALLGEASGQPTFGVRYGLFSQANGGSQANYAVYSNGDLHYTGTLSGTSDIKLKNSIKSLGGTLEKILMLDPKQYFYNTEEYKLLNLPKGEHYGLIAQELEKVYPQLVSDNYYSKPDYDTKEVVTINYKGINYVELIPILIQAIKEQQVQIEELKQKVNELSK